MEFVTDSAEDLCVATCDNAEPIGWWVFTFGSGQKHEGYLVKIQGTRNSARKKMFEKYGEDWAFQYSIDEWGEWLRKKPSYIPEEKVLEVIK